MNTPIIKSERLALIPLSTAYSQEIFTNWTQDSTVAKYMRWNTHKSLKETIGWLELEEQNISSDKNFTWGFKLIEGGSIIGSGGLVYNAEKNSYELGYNLMRNSWGMGYATEAAMEIIAFGRDVLHLDRIYCCHHHDNLASQRVIEKLGFVYGGEGSYFKFDGSEHSCKEYWLNLK